MCQDRYLKRVNWSPYAKNLHSDLNQRTSPRIKKVGQTALAVQNCPAAVSCLDSCPYYKTS